MRPHLFSLLGLLLVTAALFYRVLLPLSPVVASDSPYHQIVRKAQIAAKPGGVMWSEDGYLGNGHSANYELYSPIRRFVPFKYYNTVLFPLCVFLAGLGLYAFLCVIGLKSKSAFVGALALILSGHFITCVFSGHAGTFMMWAVFMWDLFALTCAVKFRSIIAMVWAGLLSALVLRYQFDIGFLLLIILFFWFLVLLWKEKEKKQFGKLFIGTILSLIVFCAFGAHAFFYVLGISNDSASNAAVTESAKESKLEKWDWATQWSFPMSETSSLLFPGIYGWGNQDAEAPYYGAIVRSLKWPQGGIENFSINTQGEGAAILLLALLAVSLLFSSYREKWFVIFWLAVAIAGLLFSYGRYCDISPGSETGFGPYRLFYLLPKMSDMRNPIKFLYPFMLAVSVLCALGFNTLAKEEKNA